MNTNRNRRPDFNVFVVSRKNDSRKGFWTKIGAAWKHPEGEGLNVTLIATPIDGELVLLPPKADESDAGSPE